MILKSNESLGTALYGVTLNIESMSNRVAELAMELDESKRLVESLRRLSDMIGTRLVDKFGDDELEAIYAEWEALEMANALGNRLAVLSPVRVDRRVRDALYSGE